MNLLLFQGSTIGHDRWQKRLDFLLRAVSALPEHSKLRVIVQVSQAEGVGGLLILARTAKRKSQRNGLRVGNSIINPADVLRCAKGLQLHGVLRPRFQFSARGCRLLCRTTRKNCAQGNKQFFTCLHFLASFFAAVCVLAGGCRGYLHSIACLNSLHASACVACVALSHFLWKFLIRVR